MTSQQDTIGSVNAVDKEFAMPEIITNLSPTVTPQQRVPLQKLYEDLATIGQMDMYQPERSVVRKRRKCWPTLRSV